MTSARVVAALVAVAASVGAAPAPAAVIVGRTTTMEADGSQSARVYLPVSVMPPAKRTDPSYPRFAVTTTAKRFAVVQLRMAGDEPADQPAVHGYVVGRDRDTWAPDVLPAGWYDLVVYADSGHTTVRLTLPTLTGEARATPETNLAAAAAREARSRPSALAPHTVRGGLSAQLAPPLLFFAVDFQAVGSGRVREELCAYGDEVSSEDGTAFDVGCPGGSSAVAAPPYRAERSGWLLFYPGGSGDGGLVLTISVGKNATYQGPPSSWSVYMAQVSPPYAPVPPPPLGAPPLPSPPAAATPAVRARRLFATLGRVRGRAVAVSLRCARPVRCTGSVRLRPGGRPRAVRVPAGENVRVRLRLARALSLRIARRGSARATLEVVESGAAGSVLRMSRRVVLRR